MAQGEPNPTRSSPGPGQRVVVGILLFDGAEELDWAGPWEAFSAAAAEGGLHVFTAAESSPVRCAKGLRVLADHTLEDAPTPLDVVLVPGGVGTRTERHNPRLLSWLQQRGSEARWIVSVCTGALVLQQAGFLDGRRATTHWSALGELQEAGHGVEVVRGERWVVDGNVVTAAGVSAGIDVSLWLIGELLGHERGRLAALYMEYDPQPPYEISGLRGW